VTRKEGEEVEAAAIRELEEETGFRAGHMVSLGRYFASPGMSSEGFTLLRAEEMVRTGEGGGVEGENILVHRVPLSQVADFVASKRAEGCAIDVKLLLLLAGELLGDS
jgi:ADP-ribose pyrophosphatase